MSSANSVLNPYEFTQLLHAGYTRLKESVSVINALNVFPVPDGDTGTNMELSLASGIKYMADAPDANLPSVVQALATGLLMGARGNSGVILSQLLRGFTQVDLSDNQVDVQRFATALQAGVEIAYRAVAKPVEGTILTVAREAAAVGRSETRATSDFGLWMDKVLAAARATLAKTPNMLPVLKQAGVVDSGGQGLVFLLEGFSSWLNGTMGAHAVHEASAPASGGDQSHIALTLDPAHHTGEYGYCTEVLVRVEHAHTDLVEADLREKLSRYGDSLLVVSAPPHVKVHVHTLHPGRVMEDVLPYGPLVKIKVDNMTEQFEAAHGGPYSVADRDADAASESVQPSIDAAEFSEEALHNQANEAERQEIVLVAVGAGAGVCEVFRSLGVAEVVSGGQSMNPSTEELVQAVSSAMANSGARACILLPNNKNVIMSAEQARQVVGEGLYVVKTVDPMQGLASVVSFLPTASVSVNLENMQAAAEDALTGVVVRAVRDTHYEGFDIEAGQHLAMVRGQVVSVNDSREQAFLAAIRNMWTESSELLTVFYGDEVSAEERSSLEEELKAFGSLELDFQYGGQPVYDYLITLE